MSKYNDEQIKMMFEQIRSYRDKYGDIVDIFMEEFGFVQVFNWGEDMCEVFNEYNSYSKVVNIILDEGFNSLSSYRVC